MANQRFMQQINHSDAAKKVIVPLHNTLTNEDVEVEGAIWEIPEDMWPFIGGGAQLKADGWTCVWVPDEDEYPYAMVNKQGQFGVTVDKDAVDNSFRQYFFMKVMENAPPEIKKLLAHLKEHKDLGKVVVQMVKAGDKQGFMTLCEQLISEIDGDDQSLGPNRKERKQIEKETDEALLEVDPLTEAISRKVAKDFNSPKRKKIGPLF